MAIDRLSKQRWENMPRKGKVQQKKERNEKRSVEFLRIPGDPTWSLMIKQDDRIEKAVFWQCLSGREAKLCAEALRSVGIKVVFSQ